MNKTIRYITCLLCLALLTSCGENQQSASSSQDDISKSSSSTDKIDSSGSDSSNDEASPLAIAINNTKDNFEFETNYVEVDNIYSQQNHSGYKNVRYDGENSIYWSKYLTHYDDENGSLEEKKKDIENYRQLVYYYDENGTLSERFKNEEDVWKQFTYKPQDVFNEKITDYLVPEHYTLGNDGYYYLQEEYLGGEESANIGGYYGSLNYLTQDFEYLAFSIKDGKLDKYKHKVHFTEYNKKELTYDAEVEMTGSFINIGEVSLKIPELPIYPEDVLPEQTELEEAKIKTENNYTYTEKQTVIDEDANETTYDFIEQINNRSFRYYAYSEFNECYYDEYTYDVIKENFSGTSSTTSYVTTLYYYDDHTEYYNSNAGILDDSLSKVASMGSSFGTKSFIYNEEGKYYEPRLEKPERYNPDNFTYLDYSARSFIHGVYGNFTSSTGVTYHYDFDYLRFYLTESKILSKATYKYTLSLTQNNVTKNYVVTGEGNFTNIGTTSFVVPSDPNNDIKIDSRLEGLYNSINLDNYSYQEKYKLLDENDEPIALFNDGTSQIYESILTEERNGREVKEGSYGYVPKLENQEEYEIEYVDQYFYYDEYRAIQTYKLKNYDQLYFSYPGTYSFDPIVSSLKDYLKYFTFVRTRTIDNQEANVFALKNTYLKLYANSFLKSLGPNDAVSFNSLNLTVIGSDIYRMNYEYVLYNEGEKVGTANGTINIGNFGTTEINIPNFEPANFKVTTLDDTIVQLQKFTYHSKSTTSVSYFTNRATCDYVSIDSRKPTLNNKEGEAYFLDDDGNLNANINVEGTNNPINIMSVPSVDITKIKQSEFRCDSSGDFVLKSEYKESFFENVLGIYKTHSKEDVNPGTVTIKVNSGEEIVISLNYALRFKGNNDKYITFYINQTISISIVPFMN